MSWGHATDAVFACHALLQIKVLRGAFPEGLTIEECEWIIRHWRNKQAKAIEDRSDFWLMCLKDYQPEDCFWINQIEDGSRRVWYGPPSSCYAPCTSSRGGSGRSVCVKKTMLWGHRRTMQMENPSGTVAVLQVWYNVRASVVNRKEQYADSQHFDTA